MNEEAARRWVLAQHDVSRGTSLDHYVAMVRDEANAQNLVSRATLDQLWFRHVMDSAQLLALADQAPGPWLDVGSGAGFPGMVIAILSTRAVALVEPRRKRADFLQRVVDALALHDRVTVHCARIEAIAARAAVISARAVSALPALLAATHHVARRDGLWLLPKGKTALEEVEAAQRSWHGVFHVEQSLTEPGSLIVVAKGVRPK